MKKSIQDKQLQWDLFIFISIVIIGMLQIFRCLEYPGVYLDAVNPDYLAVQILFPGLENSEWASPHSGFPLLGQLYHGTITIWLQLLIIGVTGNASIFTLRLANTIYIIAICWMCYLIMKRVGANRIATAGTILAIMLSPQVFSFVRTQYYIKLPGTFLLLCAIYCMVCMKDAAKKVELLVASGFFLGLAFYSYFIYLFFAPAMLIIYVKQAKELKLYTGRSVLGWGIGFCCGAIQYVIGYFDILITSTSMEADIKRIVVVSFGVCLTVVFMLIAYGFVKKYHDNCFMHRLYIGIGGLAGIVVIIACFCLPYMLSVLQPMLASLNVAGESMSLLQRIVQVILLWKGVMTNRFLEELMLGLHSSALSNIYVFFFLVFSIITFFVCVLRKKRKFEIKQAKIDVLGILWLFLIAFGIDAILFISRMGGQHFTPIFFLTLLILGVETDILVDLLNQKALRYFICLSGVTLILIGAINTGALNANLEFTGGTGKFTSQINAIASEALDNKKQGEKEVYIFPEWGFMCGFNYLTMNQIPYLVTLNIDKLQSYVDEDYNIKLCFWEEDQLENYQTILEDAGCDKLKVTERKNLNGEIAFYVISCSQ